MKTIYRSFPARRISPMDAHYFFGYYDLPHISGNLHLAHKIDFVDRLQQRGEKAEIGVIEMGTDKFERLDTTEAWCFQQGAMLMWNPAAPNDEIIYNSYDGKEYYATILNIHTGAKRFLDRPVATVSPKGDYALSINFERIFKFRPGYGYAGLGDPFHYENHSDKDGIFLTDMKTGKSKLILSMQQIWDFYGEKCYGCDKKIVINHITFNTDGTRFLCLVRDFPPSGQRHTTVTITANRDGSDMFLLAGGGVQSHYHWKDADTVAFYYDGKELDCGVDCNNYEIKDKCYEGKLMCDGFFTFDNHMSYSPDRKYLLTDTYPTAKKVQHLRITDLERNLTLETGTYYGVLPPITDLRCDLHPAWSSDGKLISIDSTHEGRRGIYILNAEEAIDYLKSVDINDLPYNTTYWIK